MNDPDIDVIHARPLSTVLGAPPEPYTDACVVSAHDWRHDVHAVIVERQTEPGAAICGTHRLVAICNRCGFVASLPYIEEVERGEMQSERDYEAARVTIVRLETLIVRAMRGETAPRR